MSYLPSDRASLAFISTSALLLYRLDFHVVSYTISTCNANFPVRDLPYKTSYKTSTLPPHRFDFYVVSYKTSTCNDANFPVLDLRDYLIKHVPDE